MSSSKAAVYSHSSSTQHSTTRHSPLTTHHSLSPLPPRQLSFLTELNEFLDMPGNLDQLNYARQLYDKYLAGSLQRSSSRRRLSRVLSQLCS